MMTVNKSVVSAACLMMLAGSLLAQDGSPAKQPEAMKPINAQPALEQPNKGGPFEFVTMVHDWGAISDEQPVKFSFQFKNTSDRTVKIINTRTSCGCTVGSPTKQQLAPNEEAAVEVTFNPSGKKGLELKTITLETDYTPMPNVELHLKALVRPRMVVEPSSVWFGDLPIKKGAEQEFSIMSRMEGFQVTGFTFTDVKPTDRFKVEMIGTDKVELDGGMVDRVRFKATFVDGAPLGAYNTAVKITTNDPKHAEQVVSLACRVIGELQPTPERLFVSMGGANQPWTAEVMLSSRAGQPFEIYSVEPIDTPPGMKLVVDILQGTAAQPSARNTYRIKASGITPGSPQEVTGGVKVRTNVAGMEEFTLPMMAIWRGPINPSPNLVVPSKEAPGKEAPAK